ncbi:hypothetical protein ACVWZR_001612 [Bradyrhizobium sp. i1.3.1]
MMNLQSYRSARKTSSLWKRRPTAVTVYRSLIYLTSDGGIITPLAVDLKTGKFRQLEPDPKPAASAKANPQADPGRDLGLALQIGNRTAVTAFLKHHPKGFYADLAKAQLEKIETEEAAAKKP